MTLQFSHNRDIYTHTSNIYICIYIHNICMQTYVYMYTYVCVYVCIICWSREKSL
jgi:hypothetical protein